MWGGIESARSRLTHRLICLQKQEEVGVCIADLRRPQKDFPLWPLTSKDQVIYTPKSYPLQQLLQVGEIEHGRLYITQLVEPEVQEMVFEKYIDDRGQWRWRLVAGNGKIIADSGEGYVQEHDCDHGISLVVSTDLSTPVRGKLGLLSAFTR